MKLVVDENLSPRLVAWLIARQCEAWHVLDLGLRGAEDAAIWRRAGELAAGVMTRDNDFDLIITQGRSGRLLRLECGNLTTDRLMLWLDERWDEARLRWDAGERFILLR